MNRENKQKSKKVLFYTTIPRIFRTTLIGYLYEIAQEYPVILVSEKLDSETEELLKDKKLFPKIKKIIPVRQFTGQIKKSLLIKNREFYQRAKKIIREEKPKVIIAPNDLCLFQAYLMRFGKKILTFNISVQASNINSAELSEKWVDLVNVHLRFSPLLPFWLRFFLVKCRKYFGHFFYYWVLPLTVGEKPFFGKSSYILRKGKPGMRDAHYQLVFSKKDYDIFLKDGVPVEKLRILPHPLSSQTREFFEKIYFNKFKKYQKKKKIATIIVPEDTVLGFNKKNYSLILSKKLRLQTNCEIVKLINDTLPEWTLNIKLHPDTKYFNRIKKAFESISGNIKVVDLLEPVDKYIEIGDVIIGLPLSISTALFTASLQCPEKPIISLDFFQEFLGDYYKDYNGIEYIDSREKLIKLLTLIKENKYKKNKRPTKEQEEIAKLTVQGLPQFINYLFNK